MTGSAEPSRHSAPARAGESAAYARALSFETAGQLRDALSAYDTVIACRAAHDPPLAELYARRGRMLLLSGHPRLALKDFDLALSQDADQMSAHANKATALQRLGRDDEALALWEQAVARWPHHAKLQYNFGNALRRLCYREPAIEAYRAALRLDPSLHRARQALIDELWQLHRIDEARGHAEELCAALPVDPRPRMTYGVLAQVLGHREEARRAYEEALNLHPGYVSALYNLALVDRASSHDDALIAQLRSRSGDPDLDDEQLAKVGYALGKRLDDLGAYDEAFSHFTIGAAAKRRNLPYNEMREERAIQTLETNFTQALIRAYEGQGLSTRQPVFVVGMPRSGTTLVEQILASHSQVFAAGELDTIDDLVQDIRLGAQFLHSSGKALKPGPEMLPERAHMYLDRVSPMAPDGVARIVDKMPSNAMRIGFIHLMFPNAAIIHCTRDPLDTCLSCFQKLFVNGQRWSYELRELGRHYRRYDRLMRHWHRVLPDRIMELRYEDIVADPEPQARRLIAHVGLAWDPACLEFHRNQRSVLTASNMQVREPIYTHAVGRWQLYARHLGPLIEALGPLADHARGATA